MNKEAPTTKAFSIERTLDDIPDPKPCPCCGELPHKALISYMIRGTNFLIRNDQAPGYRCRNRHCGAGLFDLQTTAELLSGAASLLGKRDTLLKKHLLREALRMREQVRS